mgnify:CR=1 FL=1
MNYVALAIPFFLLLILIELLVNYYRKADTYAFNDAINSIHLGILSQITGLAKKTIQFSFYAIIFQYIALFELGTQSLWVWVFGFIAYDFCYYWNHRMSHEINVLWASHVVHHQSEEYNLSTALRQTSGGIFGFIFYLPLALIGIDPMIILTVGSLNLVYQFWVHTKHIHLMPTWFEAIFVTPSNHRVHHAQNPIYLDKNHGGVFILWDRVFKTYQAELPKEPVIFGVTKPLASWNPIWANIEVYWGLILDCFRTQSWADKVRIWFKPTGWRPSDVALKYPTPIFDPYKQKKFDTHLSPMQKLYILIQHVSLIAMGVFLINNAASYETFYTLSATIAGVFMLFSIGWYQAQKAGANIFEIVKLVFISLIIAQQTFFIANAMSAAIIWFALNITLLWLGRAPTLSLDVNSQKNKSQGTYDS